jgi:hypothetical protein
MNVYLLFNKKNQQFMSYCESLDNIPIDNFLVKEISLESLGIKDGVFNLARYRWEGDFETGSLVDLFAENKSVVILDDVDKKYNQLFFRKYPLEQCVFEILKYLKTKEIGIYDFPMLKFFVALEDKKQKEIDFYKESKNHILETSNDISKRIDRSFEV